MDNVNDGKKKKEMKVVNGDSKNLDISPVYDHVIMDTPIEHKKDKKIIIPKETKK